MKKTLIMLAMLMLLAPVTHARVIKVAAESNFTTAEPPETWKVSLVEDIETKDGHILKAGSIIEGKITDVVQPKRLKRDASFVFVPIAFYDLDGKKYDIDYHIEGKFDMLTKIEAKKLVKTGILTAGNMVVQGISPCYQVVEGIYKNEEGNRLKSGAVAAIDATPFSYYKYGNDLVFKKGQVFKMNMIVDDDEKVADFKDIEAGEVQVNEQKTIAPEVKSEELKVQEEKKEEEVSDKKTENSEPAEEQK